MKCIVSCLCKLDIDPVIKSFEKKKREKMVRYFQCEFLWKKSWGYLITKRLFKSGEWRVVRCGEMLDFASFVLFRRGKGSINIFQYDFNIFPLGNSPFFKNSEILGLKG